MEEIEVISEKDWLANLELPAKYICQLPFSVQDIEQRLGVKFIEYEENGLGTLFSMFIIIQDKHLWLRGFGNRSQSAEPVAVYAYFFENSNSVVQTTIELLGIHLSDLVEISSQEQ